MQRSQKTEQKSSCKFQQITGTGGANREKW